MGPIREDVLWVIQEDILCEIDYPRKKQGLNILGETIGEIEKLASEQNKCSVQLATNKTAQGSCLWRTSSVVFISRMV